MAVSGRGVGVQLPWLCRDRETVWCTEGVLWNRLMSDSVEYQGGISLFKYAVLRERRQFNFYTTSIVRIVITTRIHDQAAGK